MKTFKTIVTIMTFLSVFPLFAQSAPPATPIDGGLSLLLAAGGVYGLKQIRARESSNKD